MVKIAQTFRTGTNDIDALDFVHMYLRNESQHQLNLHEFEDLYVLVNFRPVVTTKTGEWIAAWPATTIVSAFPRSFQQG